MDEKVKEDISIDKARIQGEMSMTLHRKREHVNGIVRLTLPSKRISALLHTAVSAPISFHSSSSQNVQKCKYIALSFKLLFIY